MVRLSEFFFLSLGWGVLAFSCLADTKATGVGFVKLIHGVCGAALMCATALALALSTSSTLLLYALVLGCLLLSYKTHGERKTPALWALFAIENALLLTLLFVFFKQAWGPFFYALSSIAILGIIVTSLLLGHWYLVVPKLSERPLKRAIGLLWGILLLKLTLSLSVVWGQEGGESSFYWLALSMRFLWGYVIVGVMSFFTWKLVSMRSLQSATGMLYAMTFFVFIGEIISGFFFFHHGVFL